MALFKPTNEELQTGLENAFNIPCHYSFNEDIDGFDFFVYQPITIDTKNECMWYQELNVYYVSKDKEDLLEKEIFDFLKSLKMTVESISYDRVALTDKNVHVDVVVFRCRRRQRF